MRVLPRILAWPILAWPILLTAAPQPHKADTSPTVHTRAGLLHGTLRGSTAVFQGIPYAAPPVGGLRWRAPQPAASWTGVRDATRPGSACVQNDTGLDRFVTPLAAAYETSYIGHTVASSEDCLYLNVWAPNWPGKGSPASLPVMVWLHGGSNTAGSGAQTTYDGAAYDGAGHDGGGLVSHGVILVTINYRLGVMGFFSHPELSRESGHGSSGNYGLLDQLAALRWVRENIAQFGGDANNVTLFGESAGSIDAGVLVTSPMASGLFRRVILESGPPFGLGPAPTLDKAQIVGAAIGKAAPGKSASGLEKVSGLENLRSLPAAEVVKLAATVVASQFKGFDPNSPLVDGWLIPQSPAKAFASGAIQKVDLMIGLNGRELSAFRVAAIASTTAKQTGQDQKSGGPGDALKKMADNTRPLYGNWTDAAIGLYVAKTLVHRDAARVAVIDQAANDMMMQCPVGAIASLTSRAGQRAFVYKFDRSIPGKGESDLGAFHGLEIPYVFHAFDDPGWRWLPFSETDRKLSGTMEAYWTNFARSGDPNGPGMPGWAAWTSGDEAYVDFDQNGEAAPRHGFSPVFCHLSPERLKGQLAGN
jgi:para-nitrobenzyl esterase